MVVTGAAGFAGGHLVDLLVDEGLAVDAWHRPGSEPDPQLKRSNRVRWRAIDVLDVDSVMQTIEESRPDVIFHCAAAARVGLSWEQTENSLVTNVRGTKILLEAVHRSGCRPRLLIPGSALVYRQSTSALPEDAPFGPSSPYAVSKLAQEQLAGRFTAENGCRVILTRSFNHTGPRQSPFFSASSFARSIARIEAGQAEPTIHTGNLDTRRDLTDVRDTVRAYQKLADHGVSGRIYNVCSGHAYPIREVLNRLIALARVKVKVQVNPSQFRQNDTPVVLGDPTRIRSEIGWVPRIPLKQTLSDLLDYWRQALTTSTRAGA